MRGRWRILFGWRRPLACVDETRSSTKPLYNIGNGLETASYVYAYALCGRHARFFAVKDPAVPQTPVIAIIDDDASVRAGIGRLMRSLGYIGRVYAVVGARQGIMRNHRRSYAGNERP